MITVYACSPAGGDNPGHEFMPDMVHSTAYEANYYDYYYYNTWGDESDYKKYAMPREAVKGTIPRGAVGGTTYPGISIPQNGSVPYYYKDTELDRARAMGSIINNPFPITEDGLNQGKELYNIYCAICHGEKADGLGYIVRDDGGVYPNQPAILTSDEFTASTNGRLYHAIMFGKNVMGSHADKLSYEERWQVIHYIRSLQAKNKGLEYSENVNTLNAIDVPGAVYRANQDQMHGIIDSDTDHDGAHDGDSDEGSSHGHGDNDHSH